MRLLPNFRVAHMFKANHHITLKSSSSKRSVSAAFQNLEPCTAMFRPRNPAVSAIISRATANLKRIDEIRQARQTRQFTPAVSGSSVDTVAVLARAKARTARFAAANKSTYDPTAAKRVLERFAARRERILSGTLASQEGRQQANPRSLVPTQPVKHCVVENLELPCTPKQPRKPATSLSPCPHSIEGAPKAPRFRALRPDGVVVRSIGFLLSSKRVPGGILRKPGTQPKRPAKQVVFGTTETRTIQEWNSVGTKPFSAKPKRMLQGVLRENGARHRRTAKTVTFGGTEVREYERWIGIRQGTESGIQVSYEGIKCVGKSLHCHPDPCRIIGSSLRGWMPVGNPDDYEYCHYFGSHISADHYNCTNPHCNRK